MNLRLERSLAIHDRLTEAAVKGRGLVGIAETVYELTGYPVEIEDSRGNLLASAGSRQPHPGEKERDRLGEFGQLARNHPAPVRLGDRLSAASGHPGRRLRCSRWSIPLAQPATKNESRWNTELRCLPWSCLDSRASSRPSPASEPTCSTNCSRELMTSGLGCEPSSSDTTWETNSGWRSWTTRAPSPKTGPFTPSARPPRRLAHVRY